MRIRSASTSASCALSVACILSASARMDAFSASSAAIIALSSAGSSGNGERASDMPDHTASPEEYPMDQGG